MLWTAPPPASRCARSRARDTIDGLGGTACPELRERIAKGLVKIDTLTSALDKIAAAIDSCDATAMGNYRRQLAAVPNPPPVMQEKMAELDRVAPQVAKASAAFDEANAAFKAGELSAARAKLQSAENEVRALNGKPPKASTN